MSAAAALDQATSAAADRRVLVVRIGDECFALPAADAEEVLDVARVTPLHGLPPHVAGVCRHRDRWIPAVDAAPALGLPPAPRASAVVLRRGGLVYALTVDALVGLRDGDAVEPASHIDPDSLFRAEPPAVPQESPMTTQTAAPPLAVVLLRVQGEDVGVDIASVHEVLAYRAPAAVPHAPDFVEGIVHVRGAVLPVVDLRRRLGLPPAEPDADTRIVVVDLDGDRVGVVVDAVTEVVRIPAADVAEPPRLFRGLAAELLLGIASIAGRPVLLLRIDRILAAEERLQLLGAQLDTE
ncbi:MAG: chemotaxis protein CheW [Gemmatimonadetes bacterium]|nr:chemotaxis protein CheW [Gemmatimonadota bacterium]